MSGAKHPLRDQIEAMESALLSDANTPPKVLAYVHLIMADRLLSTPLSEIHAHAPLAVPAAGGQPQPESGVFHSRGTGKVRRSVDPNRVEVLDRAAEILEFWGDGETPMKTSEVFEKLGEEIQRKIGGTEPKGNLSAMMHHSPLFVSHGRKGWTLARSPSSANEDRPTEVTSLTEDEEIAAMFR